MCPTIKLLCVLAGSIAWQMAAAAPGATKPHASMPPLELLFAERARFAERLSPDGQQIAFLAPDADGAIQLCKITTEAPETPLTVSSANGSPVFAFFWIGSDRLLWQTFSEGRARLFLTHLANLSHTEILSREKRSIRLEGVVDSASPSILVGLSDGPSPFPDLYQVKLDDPGEPQLVCKNQHQIIAWAWDLQGAPVVGLRWTDTGGKELLSLRNKPTRVAFRVPPTDDLRLQMASSDGSQALVLTDHDSDFTHLEWVDLRTGSREKLGIDPMGRVDLGGVLTVGDDILAASYSDETLRWRSLDSRFSYVLTALNDSAGFDSLSILGVDKSRTRILFKRFSARDAGTVWLHDTEKNASTMLWCERPDLEQSSLSETRPIHYPANDGTRIPAYLTVPNDGKPPWPLVVFPHGGPRMRTHSAFDGRVQFLASRGYAVLQPNFRGSRGYGKAFMNAGDGQWGKGVMQTDVTDGLDYLVRKGIADPRRVAILGGSYGGYAVLAGLAFTPDRFAAGICLFGISDLVEYTTYHPVEWQAYAGDTIRQLGDPATDAGRQRLQDLSPVRYAASFKAPLLIYHGAKDTLIPVDHAKKMLSALKAADKKVDFLLAPEEAHGFSNPESEMAVYRAIELFLHEHLGGKVGPEPSESVAARLALFRQSGSR
jgi:dipeptidyl aminopeptidase/acylaminoacyl peptidase